MLMPTMRTNVFDDLFNTPFFTKSEGMMKTDIKEHDNCYDLMIDLPGVKKEDNGKYICRERYSGSYSRSFYVGDAVTEQDISAKFENGTLKLTVPKKESLPEKQNKYIAIG